MQMDVWCVLDIFQNELCLVVGLKNKTIPMLITFEVSLLPIFNTPKSPGV